MHNPPPHRPRRAPARLLIPTLAIALLAFVAPRADAAHGAKLIAKWRAVKMVVDGKEHPVNAPRKIVYEYRAGGKFIVVMSQGKQSRTLEGTWKATASKVTMTVKGKTEIAPYKVTGARLRMTKTLAGKKIVFYMKRTK
ncbi:MAG: lipocalin family protein [bacterium]